MPRTIQGAVCETEISAQLVAAPLSKSDPSPNVALEDTFSHQKHPSWVCFGGDGDFPCSHLGFPLLSLGWPATWGWKNCSY